MLHLNGFDAWIEVDGEELKTYNVEVSDDRLTVTCWIPSEAGKVLPPYMLKISYFSPSS